MSMSAPIIDSAEEILKLIPQRPPFVLVDKIYSHSDHEILSGFTIPENHVLVNGKGKLSEAGIIEHFAQTIALYQGYYYYLKNLPAPVGYIGSIRNIDIFELPEINQEIRTKLTIINQLMGVTMVSGEVYLDEKLIAQGEMRTIIAKNEE